MAQRAEIERFHSAQYVDRVMEASATGEGFLDLGDTPAPPRPSLEATQILATRRRLPVLRVVAAVLAVAALLLTPRRARRDLWPWLWLAIFGLVTALGVYAILHGWLTVLLPGSSKKTSRS